MAAPFASVPFAGQAYAEGPSRITDLILRAGEARARAAEQQGQIWGSTVAGLGQMAGGAIQDYQAQKAAQRQAEAQKQQQAQVGEFLTEAQGQGFDLQSALGALPPEARAGALDLYNKLESARSEGAKRRAEAEKLQREAEESDKYQLAAGAAALKQALGTPMEGPAKTALLGYFRRQYPDRVAQFEAMPSEQLSQVLDQLSGSSQRFQKEQADIAQKEAETQAKLAEPGFKERQLAGQEAERAALQQYRQQQLALEGGRLGVSQAELALKQAEAARGGTAGGEDASFLLQGGTADKLPIKTRAAAVEAARAAGGVDGTGFVPNSAAQQAKFSDFMDLRAKALRLKELLEDKEVKAKLGPGQGRWTGATREFLGASTKVKEAFDLFGDLSDTELRKRTGAQASKPEYDRILGFTVAATKEADSNNTNLDRMLTIMESGLNRIGAKNLPATSGLGQPSGYGSSLPIGPVQARPDGGATVKGPRGEIYAFPSVEAAEEFRRRAGGQ